MTNDNILLTSLCLTLGCFSPQLAAAEEVTVAQLLTHEAKDLPGKELTMIAVEYAPGAGDPVHKHHAHGLVYVLEGSVVMQVKGGPAVTLTPGQTFYEGPNDIHVVGRNASTTQKAKFLVFLLKDKGAPILTLAK